MFAAMFGDDFLTGWPPRARQETKLRWASNADGRQREDLEDSQRWLFP